MSKPNKYSPPFNMGNATFSTDNPMHPVVRIVGVDPRSREAEQLFAKAAGRLSVFQMQSRRNYQLGILPVVKWHEDFPEFRLTYYANYGQETVTIEPRQQKAEGNCMGPDWAILEFIYENSPLYAGVPYQWRYAATDWRWRKFSPGANHWYITTDFDNQNPDDSSPHTSIGVIGPALIADIAGVTFYAQQIIDMFELYGFQPNVPRVWVPGDVFPLFAPSPIVTYTYTEIEAASPASGGLDTGRPARIGKPKDFELFFRSSLESGPCAPDWLLGYPLAYKDVRVPPPMPNGIQPPAVATGANNLGGAVVGLVETATVVGHKIVRYTDLVTLTARFTGLDETEAGVWSKDAPPYLEPQFADMFKVVYDYTYKTWGDIMNQPSPYAWNNAMTLLVNLRALRRAFLPKVKLVCFDIFLAWRKPAHTWDSYNFPPGMDDIPPLQWINDGETPVGYENQAAWSLSYLSDPVPGQVGSIKLRATAQNGHPEDFQHVLDDHYTNFWDGLNAPPVWRVQNFKPFSLSTMAPSKQLVAKVTIDLCSGVVVLDPQ